MNISLIYLFIYILINKIQTCPLTDEYLSRCHCEILTNGESLIQCEENTLDEIPIFKRSFPYDELRLINNRINYLPSNSFDSIKTIRRINLQGNSLSFIDNNLLHLSGNYLEELILTGNNQINSLEFLTQYPLKNLRILKLDHFNLSNIDLKKIFFNLTKLEILSLSSCQLTSIPEINSIKKLNLEQNYLTNTIFLSTNYEELNLASNNIKSIILQNNQQLIKLNLSKNSLNDFYSSTISNKNIQILDLSQNQLTFIDWTISSEKLLLLNLSSNHLEKINFNSLPQTLQSIDLNSNQLKTIEENHLFNKLIFINLNNNPFDCNCHLKWLDNIIKHLNNSFWLCSSSNFSCQIMPKMISLNLTYIINSLTLKKGLFIQWLIIDQLKSIDYFQITIEQPYRQSEKFLPNENHVFITNDIIINQIYHICLIIKHKYARDKYCRKISTKETNIISMKIFDENQLLFYYENSIERKTIEEHFIYLFIGSCIGGLLTLILLITCCYLCYKIHRYQRRNNQGIYQKCSQHFSYPICHSHHQMIYNNNSENLSNSTDSTTSSCTTKHIYQTIDSQDYCTLNRQDQHELFHLWNDSLRLKR